MRKKKFSPVRIIFYLVLILFLIYQLYPIIWMIITSLKSPADVQRSSPFSFPDPIFTENYINAIKKADLLLYFRNSAVVTIWSFCSAVRRALLWKNCGLRRTGRFSAIF